MVGSMLKNYLGFGPTPNDEKTDAVRALPASWYTSQEMYELERRSIFCKKWLLTTHKMRLPSAGDWLKYNIAGYPFILVKDREGNINAFHNVCRHRAFPVVTEEGGTSRIFSCQYHGWSYGLNGKLAKAPGFQHLEGFDKSKNGLLPIHVHVDNDGFIWVNLDGGEQPEVAWEDDFEGIDRQTRFEYFNIEEYQFDHTWEMEGPYNWKLLADNYNECHHGQTAHPDTSNLADLKNGSIDHAAAARPDQIEKDLRSASTYYFPNASMTVSPHCFFMQRFVPTSSTNCSMRYEVYRNKDSSEEDFQLINSTYKRIMSEDKYLCVNSQKNLDNEEFVNCELHPEMEKGQLYFQQVVRELVTEHQQREEKEGHEIWPAQQRLPGAASTSREDIDFCSKLTSQSQSNSGCATAASQPSGCCSGAMDCQGNNPSLVY